MKKIVLLGFFQLMCAYLFAQNITVKGVVKDDIGVPIPGANVMIKNTTVGTSTDLDGNFEIIAPDKNSVLVVSFIGYKTIDVPLNGNTSISIDMEMDYFGLDEVVAVGYGYKKKSVVTGAISSLDTEDLLQSRPANVNQALAGRASGVVVTQSSGQPGAKSNVIIRGVGTNANASPLYIVDGLPMSDINSINPSDIESLEVLKDGTSTAIYGARGANGVILIQTKKGEKGKSSITYNSFVGSQNAYNQPELLNTAQYVELMPEFYTNDGKDPSAFIPELNTANDTDWLAEIAKPALVTEHNISASTGFDKGSILFSLGYRNQNGIIGEEKSYYKRYNARLNAVLDINKYVSVGANINYAHIDKNGLQTGDNGYNPVYYALQMDPTTPVYDAVNGDELGYGVTPLSYSRMWNPMSFMHVTSNGTNLTNKVFGNSYFVFKPIKGLTFRSDFSINISDNQASSFGMAFLHSSLNKNDNNSISQSANRSTFWQWENTVNYLKAFDKHTVQVLVGHSASLNTYDWMNASRNNLPAEADINDNYWYLTSGDVGTSTNNGSASAVHTIESYFGRVSYDFDEKYMAEFVVRSDASSNFGPKNKWGVFPGVSAGWNVSSEDFWNVKNFDFLKARISWGQNGNESIDPFSYTSLILNDRNYTLGNGSVVTGSSPKSFVNENVMWETSEQLSFGADMAFFNSKLRGSVDYYTKKTKDLLFKRTVEKVRGNDAPFYNLGSVTNKGWEFQLGYNDMIGEVQFSVNANANYLHNNVDEIANDTGYQDGAKWQTNVVVTRMQEGLPIGYFYGYKTEGIFQTQDEINSYTDAEGNLTYPDAVPGDFKWNDKNGDGEITAEDKQNIGNPWPKWTFGLNLAANWKGIDASIFLSGKADVDAYMAHYRTEGFGRSNLPTYYLDRWQKAGDNNGVPRLSIADNNNSLSNPSDFWIRDASYIKIGTLELGYTFPSTILNHAKIQNLRLYVAADNLAMFTKYPMFDPEVGAMNGGILNTGMDYSMYPQARTLRAGLTIGF